MRNARLEDSQAGIKIARRNINDLGYADDITLMRETVQELKSLLMEVKKLAKNSTFIKGKLWYPIPSLHGKQMGKKVETVTAFIYLGSKITADGDCSHEIKTLAPQKKSYDQPRQHTKKQRHHFTDQALYSQSYGFSSSQQSR